MSLSPLKIIIYCYFYDVCYHYLYCHFWSLFTTCVHVYDIRSNLIFKALYEHYTQFFKGRCYSSLPVGGSGDPGGSSAAAQTAAPSASLWFSSSCQMMELESGTFSASGIPEPVTATLAGPGSCIHAWEKHD